MSKIVALQWPGRPSRRWYAMLGVQQVWRETSGQYQIRRFLGGSKRFIVMQFSEAMKVTGRPDPFELIGSFPSLHRAKNFCVKLAREQRQAARIKTC